MPNLTLLRNLLKKGYKYKGFPSRINIQGVPGLADQIETVYSLMEMKVKNV
jgi:hypothetical protein